MRFFDCAVVKRHRSARNDAFGIMWRSKSQILSSTRPVSHAFRDAVELTNVAVINKTIAIELCLYVNLTYIYKRRCYRCPTPFVSSRVCFRRNLWPLINPLHPALVPSFSVPSCYNVLFRFPDKVLSTCNII